jgi:hypothetical protein
VVNQGRSKWVSRAARAGFAAKGVVYGLVGGLAVASVVGSGGDGQVGGSPDAVRTIGSQPYGEFLLIATGIGLFGYALWRLVQAYYDPEHAQGDKLGPFKRLGYVASSFLHGALGVAAFQMATGNGQSQAGQGTFLRDILTIDTVGPILAFAAGVFIIGYALYQVVKGAKKDFVDSLKTGRMSSTEKTAVTVTGQVGLIARGVVFGIIGVFVIRAAVNMDPSKVKGVGGALHEIASQPWGALLLVLVAGGLAAYGAYQVALARYREMPG